MQWIQFDARTVRLVEAAQREYLNDLEQAGFRPPVEAWVARTAPHGKHEWSVNAGFVQYLAERAVPFAVLQAR